MAAPVQLDILSLSPEQRLDLIERLWDSLDQHDFTLTTAQEQELDRRLAKLNSGEDEAIPWETVKAELNRRS